MEPFRIHTGVVAPMDRENVDTDAIIPKQFLKSIKRSGFGPNLFDAWRYLDPGEPGQDPAARRPNPDFVLNQPRFKGAGFEWREPGCSMCLAMNADRLEPGERCASTSNRNFEGRQGAGGRTHLVSPAMAAAAALAGHFVDVRRIG